MAYPNFFGRHSRSHIDYCLRRSCSSSIDCDLVRALIFLVIGNYLPKSLGLATKNHSESSKSVARKLGYLMVAMSLVLLISLCFNPYTTIMVLGIFIVLILSILLPNFRSLRK
mgnify:CR=1 FL=1